MSYISRKDRLFRAAGDAVPALRRRSEGRMKTYNSCTDTRAWELEEEPRRQHLLEVINGYSQTLNLGKYVPIDVLINTLLASKDEVINKLKIKIIYLQKIIEAYKKLPLTDEQKRLLDGMLANIKEEDEGLTTSPRTAGDSEFETEEERSYVGDIPESELISGRKKGDNQSDVLTEDNIMSNAEKWLNENMEDCSCSSSSNNLDEQDLQTVIIMKDAEIVSLKNKLAAAQMELREKAKGALDAVHKLEDINESMVDKSELVKQLRISADLIKKLEKEKAELIQRLAKQGQPVELQDLEKEITTIRSSGNLTPEEETEVIKKELRVLKEYCAKLSAIKEENVHLRNEYERLRSELWSEKRRKPSLINIAKRNEIERLKSDHERLSDIDKRLMLLRRKDQFDDGEEADDLMYVRGQLINLENENRYLKDIIKNLEEKLKNNEPLGAEIKETRNIAAGKNIIISEQDASSDKYKKLTDRIKELEEERKSLLDELEEYRQYAHKVEEELKHMKSTNLCACDEIRKLRTERDMLKKHTIDNQSLIEEIENLRFEVREIEKLRKDRDRIKARLEELANIEQHFIKLVERTKDFDIIREENDMLKCKCEEMEDLQDEVHYLRASIETHEIKDNEKNMLKEQLSDLQRYITTLEEEVKELRSHCEGLMNGREKQQERATFAMNELRRTIEEKDERICELCCELRHIAKMKDDLVEVQSQLKQSIEGIEREENDKKSEMQNLVTTINHLQSENNKSNEIINKLQRGETDGHMENLFSLTKIAVDAILEEVDQQKKQGCSSNLTEKCKMLQNENMKLKEESELLHANLLKTQNNCDRLESDLQKTKRDVETTENENISLRRYSSDIENMAEETLENVIKRLKEVIIDNKKLKEENKELREKINLNESMSDNENKKNQEKSEMLQQFNINEEETKEINVTPSMVDNEEENNAVGTDTNEKEMNETNSIAPMEDNKNISTEQYNDSTVKVKNEEENNAVGTFNVDTNEKETNETNSMAPMEDNKNISTEQYDDSTVEVIIVDAESEYNETPQNITIEELIIENKKSSKENEELKKEIVRVQNMNNELISEIESIKEGSNLTIEAALIIEQPENKKEDSSSKEQIKMENCFCPSSTSIVEEQKENINNLDLPQMDNCVCPESMDDNITENEGISNAQMDAEIANIMNGLKGLDHESLLAKYELMAKENIILKDNIRKLENQLQNLNDIKNIIKSGDDNDIMKKYNELLKENNNLTDRLRRCEDEANRREPGSVARTGYTADGISRPTKDTFKEQKEGASKKGTDGEAKESGGNIVSSEEEITFTTAIEAEAELTAGNSRYPNYGLGGNDTVNISKKVAAIDGNDERRQLIETTVDGEEIVAMSKKAADIGGKEGGRRLIDALDEDGTVIMSKKEPIIAGKETGKTMIESTLTSDGTTVVKKTGADFGREDDARILYDQTLDDKQVFDDTAKNEPAVLDSDGVAADRKEVVGDKNVLDGGGAKVLSQKGITDKNVTDEIELVNLKDGTVVKERIAKSEEEGLKGFDGRRKDSPDADQEKKTDMKDVLKEQPSKDIAQELEKKETVLTTDKSKDGDGKDQSYLELKKKNEDLQNENKKLKDQIKICEEELGKPISGAAEESKGQDDDLKNKYEKLLKENEQLKGQIKQLEEEIKNKDLNTSVKGEDKTASAEKEGKTTVQVEDTTSKTDKNKESGDLKKQNEELLNEIQKLKEQTKNYEDKIKDMDKAVEKGTMEQVDEYKSKYEALLQENKKLKDDSQIVGAAITTESKGQEQESEYKKRYDDLLKDNEKLKDQIKKCEDELDKANKDSKQGPSQDEAKGGGDKTIEDLKRKNDELLAENSKLKEQNKKYEENINNKSKDVGKSDIKDQAANVGKDLNGEYKKKFEDLEKENAKLKERIKQLEEEIAKKGINAPQEKQQDGKTTDETKRNEETGKLKERIKQLEEELAKKDVSTPKDTKQAGDKNEELRKENEKFKERIKQLEGELAKKGTSLPQEKPTDVKSPDDSKKYEELRNENERLKERIKQLEQELAKKGVNIPQEKSKEGKPIQGLDDSQKQKPEASTDEINKLKEQIKKYEDELKKQPSVAGDKTIQENNRLKEEIKKLQEQGKPAGDKTTQGVSETEHNALKDKYNKCVQENNDLKSEVKQLQEQVKSLGGEVKTTVNVDQTEQVNKSEYDILKRKNDDLVKENNDLKQQLSNVMTSDKEKPTDNVNGQQNIQSQPKTLESSRPTAQTEKEKKDVLNTIDGLESQLKNLQQAGASKDFIKSDDGSINTTIKNLTKALEDEQKRNKGLENEIRRLKDENHKLKNEIAVLKGEPPIQRDSIRSSATESLDKSARKNLESIKEEGHESVDKLKKQIDSLNTRHSQEKEKMEKRYKNNVNTLRGQYQRDVKSIHSMHQESLSRLQHGHEESLSELSAEFERDVNILRDMVKDLRSENSKLKGEIEKMKKMLEILDPDNKKLAELGKLSELLLSTTDYSDILNAGVKKDLGTDGKGSGAGESAKLQDLPRLVVMVNNLLPHEKLNAMTLDELTMLHEQVCAAAARMRGVAIESAMGAQTRIGRLEEHLSNKQARMQRKVAELEMAVRRERSRLHSMRNEFDNDPCVGGCTPRRPKTRSSSID